MKLKYFMRGLGAGIIFSAIILTIFFQNTDTNKMSKEEIKKEAIKLGMVEEENDIDLSGLKQEDNKASEDSSDKTDSEETENDSVDNKEAATDKDATTDKDTAGEDSGSDSDTKADKENDSTDDKTSADDLKGNTSEDDDSKDNATSNDDTNDNDTTEGDNAKETDTNNEASADSITITIKPGMYASKVAEVLVKKGLIDNEKAILDYLNKKGWQEKIVVGEYEIPKNITIPQIAKILTKQE